MDKENARDELKNSAIAGSPGDLANQDLRGRRHCWQRIFLVHFSDANWDQSSTIFASGQRVSHNRVLEIIEDIIADGMR